MLLNILETVRRASGLDERRCAGCHIPYSAVAHEGLCPKCIAALTQQRSLCPLCGTLWEPAPTLGAGRTVVCGACLVKPPLWKQLHVVGEYRGFLRNCIVRMKFHGDHALARALGQQVAQRLLDCAGTEAEVILPMPLHVKRLRRRGFNQCLDMARPLAQTLGIPCQPHWVQRVAHTRPQLGLSRTERLRNLHRAFSAMPDVRGKHVLLLDDTLTTGTSLHSLAECVLAAGAREVDAAVVGVVSRERVWERDDA